VTGPATHVLYALLDGDDTRARVMVNDLTPAERGRLADAARRLHELCTRSAQDRAAGLIAEAQGSFVRPGSGQFRRPSASFLAAYDGVCSRCKDQITGGEDVVEMTDRGAVHTGCTAPGGD
jgi:hypothetical protein